MGQRERPRISVNVGNAGGGVMVTVSNVLEGVIRAAKAPRRIPLGKIHPSGVELRRFERQGTEQIARALQTLRRRLFAGLSADTVSQVVSRMNDREIIQPFRDTFAALIQEWALAGSDFGREQVERVIFGTQKQVVGIAIDWALANESAAEWAQNYAYDEFTAALEERIKSRLRKEIINFVRNDETFQSFSRRMASDAMFGKARGQMIAVTEVTRAYAEGNKIAWRESGVTEGMEWNTANDELVCPICGPLDGDQVPLDDEFDGGFEAPPAHPRCRCWLTPVTVGDLETGQDIFDRLGLERGPFPGFVGNVEAQDPLTWFENEGPQGELHFGERIFTPAQAGEAKNKIVNTLSEETGISYDRVDHVIAKWASTSNDRDIRALHMQKMASEVFDKPLSTWQKGKIKDLIGDHSISGMGILSDDETKRLLRAMYDNTQEQLSQAGIKSVRLYRGINVPRGGMLIGDTLSLDSNAIESWSLNQRIAGGFGDIAVSSEIPASDIIGSARTGFGCLNEYEFVISGEHDATIWKSKWE